MKQSLKVATIDLTYFKQPIADIQKNNNKTVSITSSFTLTSLVNIEKIVVTSSNTNNQITLKVACYSIFNLLIKNQASIIKHSMNKAPSIPNECFLKSICNIFYLIGIGKVIYTGIIQDENLYLLNSSYNIIKIINLKKVKKIGIRKKSYVSLIYDDKKQTKYLSLLSSFNRNIFCSQLLSIINGLGIDNIDQEKLSISGLALSKPEIIFQRQLLYSILQDKNMNILSLVSYFKNRIYSQSPKSYYQYNQLKKYIDFSNGNLNNKNLIYYLFNLDLVNSTLRVLFNDFRYLPFDFSKDVNYFNYIKKTLKKYKKDNLIENRQNLFLHRGFSSDTYLKQRVRHQADIKRKRPSARKCNFENVSFSYYRNSNCSGGQKKIIVSTGCFQICKGDAKTATLYFFKNIERLNTSHDGEHSNSFLQIIINNKIDNSSGTKQQETFTFYFLSPYERYLFQSLVYNYLVYSLENRKIINNQLTLNCNVMTWNLAGIDVPKDLYPLFNSKSLENVDILSIGVQECGLFKVTDWMKTLKRIMNYYGFVDVTSVNMFQMFLCVFIKSDLYPLVDNISSEIKPMGFAKILGNKGGMVISFKICNFRMVFVNCHLAPKPHKVLERNKHAKGILQSVRVGEKTAEFDTQADYLYWMGDFNYRVDYIYEQVLEEISRNNLQFLLSKDQLIRQKQQNHIFTDFQEAEINFWPTYRRIKGTDEYSNKKNQSPSWCDRVLIKTERNIDILFYDSIQEVNLSDHLPVISKSSIFLTTPIIEDIDKLMDQKIQGKFCFSNITVDYNFTEGLSEIDEQLTLPVKVKLYIYYFNNDKKNESKSISLKTYDEFNLLEFDDVYVQCPPQFLFDLALAKSMNFIFVLQMTMNGSVYEIGFSKFSLENIESLDSNLLSFSHEMQINFRTRNMGRISFDATYKM